MADLDGNSTTGHMYIDIDKTLPTITAVVPHGQPSGWYTAPVPVSFDCEDHIGIGNPSGIASCSGATTVLGDGAGQSVTGTTVDAAGNAASVTKTLNIDSIAPTIQGTVSTATNGNGWSKGAVTVHWTCADATSGVAYCPPDTVVTQPGTTTVSAFATDVAGNVSAPASVTVSIDDGRATSILPTVTPALNNTGWQNQPVTVHFSCAAISGVASCTGDQTLSTAGAGQVVNGTVVDRADNSASSAVTVNLDFTPPTVAVTGVANGATYVAGSVPAPGCSSSDSLSGLANAAVLGVSGGAPDGTGAFTATCAGASDNAGNTGSASATYTVIPNTGTIIGTVTTTAGAPVAGAFARIYTTNTGGGPVLGAAVADSAGRYAIHDIAPGTYYVYAGLSGATYAAFGTTAAVVTAGSTSTVNVAVVPGATGSGTVTGPSGPVGGATVRLMLGGNPTSKRVETDSAGHYTLTGVTAGTYTVMVVAYGYIPLTSAPFTVTTSTTVVPSPDVQLAVAPSSAGLAGTVTNAVGGAPVAGAPVRLWLVDCVCATNYVVATTTAADGTWSISTLPSGTYNVQFAKPGSATGYFPTSIIVSAGTTEPFLTTTWNLSTGTIAGSYAPGH